MNIVVTVSSVKTRVRFIILAAGVVHSDLTGLHANRAGDGEQQLSGSERTEALNFKYRWSTSSRR